MEYYAEQSLLIKIIIFVIAWLIIAILGKISVPQIPIPKWLKTFFCGWFKGNSFGLPWMFLQAGNYLLFLIYALGDVFHYTSRLPASLPDWIWFIFASLFTVCAIISAIMIAIEGATISIRGRKKAKKINQYGSLKRKRNKRSIYRDRY